MVARQAVAASGITAYSCPEIKAATRLQVHNAVGHDLPMQNHYTGTLKAKGIDVVIYEPAMEHDEFFRSIVMRGIDVF